MSDNNRLIDEYQNINIKIKRSQESIYRTVIILLCISIIISCIIFDIYDFNKNITYISNLLFYPVLLILILFIFLDIRELKKTDLLIKRKFIIIKLLKEDGINID